MAETLKQWIAEMKAQYRECHDRPVYVVPAGSLAARGYEKCGRKLIATITSPWGGQYRVYDSLTERERINLFGN